MGQLTYIPLATFRNRLKTFLFDTDTYSVIEHLRPWRIWAISDIIIIVIIIN